MLKLAILFLKIHLKKRLVKALHVYRCEHLFDIYQHIRKPTPSRPDPHPIPITLFRSSPASLCFGFSNCQLHVPLAPLALHWSLAMAVEGSQTKKLKVATMAPGATAPSMVDHALVEADEAWWIWWPWEGKKGRSGKKRWRQAEDHGKGWKSSSTERLETFACALTL